MEKIVYRNLGDGEATPVPREIIDYFIEKYAGQRVTLNATRSKTMVVI